MDPGRQVALAAVNFKDSTDWTLLERLYAQVRRQALRRPGKMPNTVGFALKILFYLFFYPGNLKPHT